MSQFVTAKPRMMASVIDAISRRTGRGRFFRLCVVILGRIPNVSHHLAGTFDSLFAITRKPGSRFPRAKTMLAAPSATTTNSKITVPGNQPAALCTQKKSPRATKPQKMVAGRNQVGFVIEAHTSGIAITTRCHEKKSHMIGRA
jgi:hypothetical protein